MTSNIQQKIEALVLPIMERMGYKLWGCQCLLNQKQRLIRIFIDKPDGILLTDCEQVSHAVSAVLDVEDVLADQYRLEISSPGLPKPLFYPWQYQESVGQKVRIKLIRVIDGHRWLIGDIISTNEQELSVQHEGVVYQVAWANISKAFIE
ncbi:MAG TPA: ribosome maturation factor RimP [Legionellales bacterium]|nr:ribosome maturation factor RimP [Legionellales bacterium]